MMAARDCEEKRRRERKSASKSLTFVLEKFLTVLIDESRQASLKRVLQIATGLVGFATVWIEVDVAQWVWETQDPAIRVDHVHERGVRPRQVALVARVHVERIGGVQPSDPAHLFKEFLNFK